MARVDSLIFFLTGFAQLIIASEIETALVALILQGTGSGMLALGVYFLFFVARNHKEFSDRYSKSEKTVLVRDPVTGDLRREDATPVVNKAVMYGGPTALTFLAALFWLANWGDLLSSKGMSDRVDDVINNPAYDMLGGYHIFLRRMLIPIIIILIALLVWTITESYISSSLTRKVVTAVITGLSLGPVTNFDRGVAEWLRRRNKVWISA